MAENQRRGLLCRQAANLAEQIRTQVRLSRIGFDWATQAANQLADLSQAALPHIGEGGVDRNPVDPCFGRRISLPGAPAAKSLQEGFLSAVLRGRDITEQGDQGAKDARVRFLIKAVEVCFGSRPVFHSDAAYIALLVTDPFGLRRRSPVQITGTGDDYAAKSVANYPNGSVWHAVDFFHFRAAKILRQTSDFASSLEPAEWRARWVERSQVNTLATRSICDRHVILTAHDECASYPVVGPMVKAFRTILISPDPKMGALS